MQVPPTREERNRIRQCIVNTNVDNREVAVSKEQLESLAKIIVTDEMFVPWTMVLLGSYFWKHRVENVPYSRRILLLPHCLKNQKTCQAKYNAEGLQCTQCGGCELGRLKQLAEGLGYQVLIAEGSPVVLKRLTQADAILGVGCLRSLSKAFQKLQLTGIPAMAVPLHGEGCKDSATDIDWVEEMIYTPYISGRDAASADLFIGLHAENETERIAFNFLKSGGKFYRPKIVFDVFNALKSGTNSAAQYPIVNTAAQCVEVFHKASLVHDDIEDDDEMRYGKPALHTVLGIPAAVNIGDFLIGYGYDLIAQLRDQCSPDIIAEMFSVLTSAHRRLCVGQGDELLVKPLAASGILTIYENKTGAAFDAALKLGMLCAVHLGSVDWNFYRSSANTLTKFAVHIGIAFQIRNDIDGWETDTAKNRPTLLSRVLAPVQTAEDLIRLHIGEACQTALSIEHTGLRNLLVTFAETLTCTDNIKGTTENS